MVAPPSPAPPPQHLLATRPTRLLKCRMPQQRQPARREGTAVTLASTTEATSHASAEWAGQQQRACHRPAWSRESRQANKEAPRILSRRAAVCLRAFGGDCRQLIAPPIRTALHASHQGQAEARSPSEITCLTVRLLLPECTGAFRYFLRYHAWVIPLWTRLRHT